VQFNDTSDWQPCVDVILNAVKDAAAAAAAVSNTLDIDAKNDENQTALDVAIACVGKVRVL
jgi:hypothetical protein